IYRNQGQLSSRGQGCSPRKDDLQDLFKEKTTSLGDLFYWRIPNSTIYDSSCAFVYPVTQGLTDTESALTQESHTDNPDNVASEAELHVPVQATDATENDVYIHPGLADRQNQHNEDVELDAEGAVHQTQITCTVSGPVESLHNLRAEDLQAILDEWDTPLSPEALLEENKRLRGRTKCHSCDEKELKILFLPCGHLVACEVCAEKFSQCPCCKAKITGRGP
ncbi:PIAP-like protein, partial [Mya arenaria]